ncbi:hypothetical protein [Geodermatophilus sp. URMC 64]
MTSLATEFEDELEFEQEYEAELEDEDEAFLGGIARAVGGLLGEGETEAEWEDESEGELELEDEFEAELEDELEFEDEDEAFLGGIARAVGGLLGESEEEAEDEWEIEGELEDEAEEFFKRIGRGLRKMVKSPVFRSIVKKVGPLVATAVGGPAAGMIARAAVSQLEGELEAELEAELEEMASAPLSGGQSLAEYLAAQAASSQSEAEAEAFAGVAAYASLSARDRRDLERMLPALLRGAAVVTRLLRRDPRTRSAVRLLPGIVDASGRTLARRVARGVRTGPADVGAVMGRTAQRVLGGAGARSAVLRRHARGLAHVRRHRRAPGWGYGPSRSGALLDGRRYPGRATVIRRQPTRTGVTTARGVSRPRPGFVRVVTPVRVPARGGQPPRTVRVVSDVRVPRGATPAGRPISVSGRRGR